MLTTNYEQFIIEEIKGLPQESLAEIAYFVYFMHQRAKQPQIFELALQTALRGISDTPIENFTLGEHLVAGLQDIILGRVTQVNTQAELTQHLDSIFAED